MAYGVRLDQKCQSTRCPRAAKVRVLTQRGETIGVYCETCADRKLSEVNAAEAAAIARRDIGGAG